jgi:hypothetical protein
MFLATRETVLATGGGFGGGIATRSGVARRPSFRSGPREDARFGPPWFGCPHSAPEQSAESRLSLPLLGSPRSAPEWTVLRGLE